MKNELTGERTVRWNDGSVYQGEENNGYLEGKGSCEFNMSESFIARIEGQFK